MKWCIACKCYHKLEEFYRNQRHRANGDKCIKKQREYANNKNREIKELGKKLTKDGFFDDTNKKNYFI